MFSQQNKAAKLAWLESDLSKPPATGQHLNQPQQPQPQIGRNLFEATAPSFRYRERQESLLAESLNNQQPQQLRNHNHQQRVSGSSFVTNHTSDSISDEDDPRQAGSSRQLQKRRRFSRASLNSTGSSSDKPVFNCWPRDQADANTRRRRQEAAYQQHQAAGRRAGERAGLLERLCRTALRLLVAMGVILALNLLVYLWPIDPRLEFEPRVSPARPRPRFEGPLAINSQLDELGEKLFEKQFHAPESMAWTADRRAFFTGVEGGFILFVEPYADRWTVAAKLNARQSVEERSRDTQFEEPDGSATASSTSSQDSPPSSSASNETAGRFVPFCSHDVRLYGQRAEFEPSLVELSRCSRPLGIRLAPDNSRLYVADPLSGLYRVELAANWSAALADRAKPLHRHNKVVRLLDFQTRTAPDGAQPHDGQLPQRPERHDQVLFGDDIAVHFDEARQGGGGGDWQDVIYLTDCSRRWSLRYLFWLMLENDDTGRVLRFDVARRRVGVLAQVTPTIDAASLDARRLSFPNGLELTADKSALLISDLNNRRILRHQLTGPGAGETRLLMWVPGYSDNIRRGLDEPDGTPTYWFACGCAVGDGKYEVAELFNELPSMKRLLLRWLHLIGTSLDGLGRLLDSSRLRDAGLMFDGAWLKVDPYCTHGLVAQFDEQGRVLRSLHGPGFGSSYKLLSEAHQVPHLDQAEPAGSARALHASSNRSTLYLGSVYYSYLGRLELDDRHFP